MTGGGATRQLPATFSARALAHDFDDLIALEPLDLTVRAGDLVMLVGHNGAGKSTLLRIGAGLIDPADGHVLVRGSPPGSVEARAATAYVPDTAVLYGDLSLNEQLEYVARLHGDDGWPQRRPVLLERLGLDEWGDNLPTQFSHGMRQKASIAMAIIRPFSLLLADEPFNGLDANSRVALVEILAEAREAGAAALIATHSAEVAAIASRCIRLEDGRVTYDGPPDESVIGGPPNG